MVLIRQSPNPLHQRAAIKDFSLALLSLLSLIPPQGMAQGARRRAQGKKQSTKTYPLLMPDAMRLLPFVCLVPSA